MNISIIQYDSHITNISETLQESAVQTDNVAMVIENTCTCTVEK